MASAYVPSMTDTTNTINQPAVSSEDQISKLTEIVQRLEGGMVSFSNSVIQALTGQAQGQTTAAPVTGAKRRGRPVGSINRVKAKAEAVARVPHPTEVQILKLVTDAGCLTQSELADALKVERALIQNHTDPLLESGKVKCMYWKLPGEHRRLVYYRPDWVKERSRGK